MFAAPLVRAETLALMDGQPILSNTARGGLVDLDEALDAALRGEAPECPVNSIPATVS